MAASPGDSFGDFRLIKELGSGQSGNVFLAEQISLGRECALKILAPELVRDETFLERFRREGRIAASLRHESIVRIFDLVECDDGFALAMDYIEGRELQALLDDDKDVPRQAALDIISKVLDALDYAHGKGVVHRDVKPANILLESEGSVFLTDFSIARMAGSDKLTQTGSLVGTPEYMAPEQFEGQEADARADVYATALILYELLTGANPFGGDTIAEIITKQLMTEPPSLEEVDGISAELAALVHKGLAKSPEERFQTAGEMNDALKTLHKPESQPKGEGITDFLSSVESGDVSMDDAVDARRKFKDAIDKGFKRELTIVMLDLAGSSKIKIPNQTLIADRAFQDYRRTINKILDSHGCERYDWSGDGAISLFPEVVGAVDAAVEVQRAVDDVGARNKELSDTLKVRIGIRTGMVYYDPRRTLGEFASRTVDQAGHLEKDCPAGSIRIGDKTAEVIGDRYDVKSIGKNRDDIEVFEIGEDVIHGKSSAAATKESPKTVTAPEPEEEPQEQTIAPKTVVQEAAHTKLIPADSTQKAMEAPHDSSRSRLKILVSSVVSCLLLMAIFGLFSTPIENVDDSIHGYLTRYRLTHQAPSAIQGIRDGPGERIVVLTIDEESLRNLNLSWPFPREVHAEIIRRLDLLGAKTIAFDVLFSEPSNLPGQDDALAEALKNPKVVLTHRLDVKSDKLTALPPLQKFIEGWSDLELERRLGFTVDWDEDYVALRVQQDGGKRFYSLATVLLAHFRGIHPAEVLDGLGLESRTLGLHKTRLKTDGGHLNFVALEMPKYSGDTPDQLTMGDFIQILTLEDLMGLDEESLTPGLLDSDEFMAIVGVTAPGGFDEKDLTVGRVTGLVVHANILLNLMGDNFVLAPPTWLVGLSLLAIGVAMGLGGARLSQRAFLALCLGLLASIWVVGLLFSGGAAGRVLWLPLAEPTLLIVVLTAVVALFHQQADRAELNKVLGIMQQLCPAGDIQKILAEGGLKPGGEVRELTILFSDLREYSTFVEREGDDVLGILNFLNRYFGSVSHILERYGGVVMDYQGDAQMVVFGLKKGIESNHATAAVKAGAEMILAYDSMRKVEREGGLEMPDTGVGICTGDVSFGILGSERKKQFVTIGDPTNVAARLQGKSVELGAQVLVARSTRVLAGNEVLLEFLDDVSLKGKSQSVGVFSANIQKMVQKGMLRV